MTKVANAKVKAWRRAARKSKGKDAALGPMFGATSGYETFEIPYGELDVSASAPSSEWEPDSVSKEAAHSKEPKEPDGLEREPSPRGVALEPSCVERGLPPRMAAAELGLDETMELLSRVLGARDEDHDLSALSSTLKPKLGLSDLKKPPPTVSLGVEVLTRDMKSGKSIRGSPMDTCPSPFHLRVRSEPVGSVGDTTEAEMKSYGVAPLAPLATTQLSALSRRTGDPGLPSRGTKAIATANLGSNSRILNPKTGPSGPRSSLNFYSP